MELALSLAAGLAGAAPCLCLEMELTISVLYLCRKAGALVRTASTRFLERKVSVGQVGRQAWLNRGGNLVRLGVMAQQALQYLGPFSRRSVPMTLLGGIWEVSFV